ncbi:MAG: hypothetical protein Q7S07_05575 [Candidatus Omnitrophota bacterium]|nr:hypothetical protein [Candidatus Omnitrophota bacterium]
MGIDKFFQSEIHAKIMQFFHENQASIDTPRGIATWVAEERSKVMSALEDLVKAKVLVAHRTTSTTGYSYTSDALLISKIGKLLKKRKSS